MLDHAKNTAPLLRPTIPPSAENVLTALRGAADRTGADFGYLLNTAMRESSLNPNAKASTSSATGLFQFIEQTWLSTLHKHGAAHGLGRYADAIKPGKDGRFSVPDAGLRQEILALRKDPQVAALMAGELTTDTRSDMEAALGRGVSAGELYVAHFLGPQAAVKLIKAAANTPAATAAGIFPDAAAANSRIFYSRNGDAKSVSTVLAHLKAKHESASTQVKLAAMDNAKASAPAQSVQLRGTVPEAGLPATNIVNDTVTRMGMDAMIMSPIMVQLMAAMDHMPSLATVFSPDDSTELRGARR